MRHGGRLGQRIAGAFQIRRLLRARSPHRSEPVTSAACSWRRRCFRCSTEAEARAAAFLVTMRTEIAALRTVVIDRRATAERYRAAAVNSAAQIERIAQVSYDAGERGILELLDAYRTGASARLRQAALDAAVRQAEIELEYVSGWEIP